MAVQCSNCGGAHPKWDCKRPAKEKDRVVVHAGSFRTAGSIPADPVMGVPGSTQELNARSKADALASLHRPRGRPRIHPDRKAYKALKERERRARKKENG